MRIRESDVNLVSDLEFGNSASNRSHNASAIITNLVGET